MKNHFLLGTISKNISHHQRIQNQLESHPTNINPFFLDFERLKAMPKEFWYKVYHVQSPNWYDVCHPKVPVHQSFSKNDISMQSYTRIPFQKSKCAKKLQISTILTIILVVPFFHSIFFFFNLWNWCCLERLWFPVVFWFRYHLSIRWCCCCKTILLHFSTILGSIKCTNCISVARFMIFPCNDQCDVNFTQMSEIYI